MSKDHSTGDHTRRQKKRQSFASSILDQPDDPVLSPLVSSDKDVAESLTDMTEEEMVQHLKLCMKLSVENKIDKKNAFGLHLIGIMQKIVNKSEKADIQQASLSLQASSKIFAGRVEALYQDTFRFHGHLQSIVSGGKEKKSKNAEDDEIDEDSSDNRRSKPQKSKCKSFLKSEESLRIEQDISAFPTGEPHGNFVTINSAFSISRMSPKLLSCLQLANDSCMLRCAIPEPSFKVSNALSNIPFAVPPKLKGILEKIKKISVSHAELKALLTPIEVGSFSPYMSTPKPAAPSVHVHDSGDDVAAPFDVSMMADSSNHSMMAGPSNSSNMPGPSNDFMMTCPSDHANSLECAIEKFDVLNITAHAFVNDISAAVTDQGIDHKLLPPNSALKKMLDRSKRTSIKPSVTKTTRLKAKEPFFARKSAIDIKHLFVKGRGTSLSQKTLSEWNIENTSNIDLGYEFIEELESKKEHEHEYNATLDQVLDVIKQNDLQYHFKYYFLKQSQMWKFSRRKLFLNESHPGGSSFGNQTEKRVGSLAPSDAEGLALSFQNLSLSECIHDIPASGENESFNEAPDLHDIPPVSEEDVSFKEALDHLGSIEDQHFIESSESFETDIEKLMVKPPELVRPATMKFDKRPVNLNTEKITDLMWLIISKHLEGNNSTEGEQQFALFSEVYEELKIKLKREISEFISMQFAFVVLLILANKKTLLIENVKDNTDLSIKQDTSEIAVTDNM